MLDWILNTPSRMLCIGIYILQKTEGAQLKGKDLFCPSVLQISLVFLLGLHIHQRPIAVSTNHIPGFLRIQ